MVNLTWNRNEGLVQMIFLVLLKKIGLCAGRYNIQFGDPGKGGLDSGSYLIFNNDSVNRRIPINLFADMLTGFYVEIRTI